MQLAEQPKPPATDIQYEPVTKNAHQKQRDKRYLNDDTESYKQLGCKTHAHKYARIDHAAHGAYEQYGDRVHKKI